MHASNAKFQEVSGGFSFFFKKNTLEIRMTRTSFFFFKKKKY